MIIYVYKDNSYYNNEWEAYSESESFYESSSVLRTFRNKYGRLHKGFHPNGIQVVPHNMLDTENWSVYWCDNT